jgi:predicted lipid-binding transport protein (Tim44 family)
MLGGLLGGLALGGLLAWAFSGTGLATILLVALLAIFAVMALRAMRRREAPAAENVQFAGMHGTERVNLPQRSASIGALHAPSSLPAGFDAAGFLRAAKSNFIKLQLANDAGQLDEIREFTTDEMFDALRQDVAERAGRQETDVVSLNADLLEVATEQDNHWASVRFSGLVRETPGAEPVGFEEVWNLVKPVQGSSGWLLAGIQQMH